MPEARGSLSIIRKQRKQRDPTEPRQSREDRLKEKRKQKSKQIEELNDRIMELADQKSIDELKREATSLTDDITDISIDLMPPERLGNRLEQIRNDRREKEKIILKKFPETRTEYEMLKGLSKEGRLRTRRSTLGSAFLLGRDTKPEDIKRLRPKGIDDKILIDHYKRLVKQEAKLNKRLGKGLESEITEGD